MQDLCALTTFGISCKAASWTLGAFRFCHPPAQLLDRVVASANLCLSSGLSRTGASGLDFYAMKNTEWPQCCCNPSHMWCIHVCGAHEIYVWFCAKILSPIDEYFAQESDKRRLVFLCSRAGGWKNRNEERRICFSGHVLCDVLHHQHHTIARPFQIKVNDEQIIMQQACHGNSKALEKARVPQGAKWYNKTIQADKIGGQTRIRFVRCFNCSTGQWAQWRVAI